MTPTTKVLQQRLSEEHFQRLGRIRNPALHKFIAEFVELCAPDSVFVSTGSEEDRHYIRQAALLNREEARLAIAGHTIHFDSPADQARDKRGTQFLLRADENLGPEINSLERQAGLEEIRHLLRNSMAGRQMFVLFYCLGPVASPFSIPCVQLTDSAYVAHSEDLLYRQGYEEFVRLGERAQFFKVVHSQGRLAQGGLGLMVSADIANRRVYIDLENEVIYSVNTQYGGNSIGLKKLAMRLAIRRASREGWLTEHMLIVGVHGPNGRVSYFTGAFPSLCGKTSTATVPGETILGDDIAYLRHVEGQVRAVNVEKGMFGIIDGVNSLHDPLIWKVLRNPGEVIFSNILVTEGGDVYWNGMDGECPPKGVNFAGEWFAGKRDSDGKEIPPSHKNARFTFDLRLLDNLDPHLEDLEGVPIAGIVYGARDSDTWVPVEEAFDWEHGIVTKGAALESETTAATLGQEGVRVFNPMSNLDFLSIPIGRYIQDNLDFGAKLVRTPRVFSVNYFLRGQNGEFLNDRADKRVWLKWMELRAHDDVGAIAGPTGLLPRYEDLRRLFKQVLGRDYPVDAYREQFAVRVPENIAKIDRLLKIYSERVLDTPKRVFELLSQQRQRLEKARTIHGDRIPPDALR